MDKINKKNKNKNDVNKNDVNKNDVNKNDIDVNKNDVDVNKNDVDVNTNHENKKNNIVKKELNYDRIKKIVKNPKKDLNQSNLKIIKLILSHFHHKIKRTARDIFDL